MTATASPPSPATREWTTGAHAQAASSDACPLCGAPLHREQEWCLRCGAAARTRLAAAPNWKVPIAALLAVIALSLGVLSAALVDLAGSSSNAPTATRTVTSPPTPTPPAAVPQSTVPGTLTPGATTPGAATPGSATPGATLPGTKAPGAATPTTTTPGTVSPRTTSTGATPPGTTAPR